jgi:hypothetical protein
MSKKHKNPPTAIYVSAWQPGIANAITSGASIRINRRIKSLAEAYALQRRLLKKAQRMLDAKRTFNVQEFHRALLAIEPGAWVREYDRWTRHTRTVTYKRGGEIHTAQVEIFQRHICIHPKEFCK